MEIWNEGEMLGKKIIQTCFKIRQLKPQTREPHCIASWCAMNVLQSVHRRILISRNKWALTSQSSVQSGQSQPNRLYSCNNQRPNLSSHKTLYKIPCCTKYSKYSHCCKRDNCACLFFFFFLSSFQHGL